LPAGGRFVSPLFRGQHMEMEAVVEWVGKFLGRFFGTQNERAIRRYWTIVREKINPLETKMMALPDAAFPKMSQEFRERLAKGQSLDEILPEAFAACREASRRTVKMRHFDVQLIGGIVLHQGKISEMATGEGKTLGATLPLYLNALSGRNVQLVTVNDYLARRDSEWMGPIYRFLGLSVGCLQNGQSPAGHHQPQLRPSRNGRRPHRAAAAGPRQTDAIGGQAARRPAQCPPQPRDGLYNRRPPLPRDASHAEQDTVPQAERASDQSAPR